jgi:hypothetical protein
MLVGSNINDENQGIVIFDLLHSALSSERILQDGELIERILLGDRLSRIFGGSRQSQGVRTIEVDTGSDLSLHSVGSLLKSLLGLECLLTSLLLRILSLLFGSLGHIFLLSRLIRGLFLLGFLNFLGLFGLRFGCGLS